MPVLAAAAVAPRLRLAAVHVPVVLHYGAAPDQALDSPADHGVRVDFRDVGDGVEHGVAQRPALGVHTLELSRKRLGSLDALARGLAKGLPEGTAPTAAELAEFKMKFSRDEKAEERVKLDPKDAAALREAAAEAHSLFAWPRREKKQ